MSIRFELLSTGVNSQSSFSSQFRYLQVVIKCTNSVLTDDIALLFLQSQSQCSVHILINQPTCPAIATNTGQTRNDDQCKKHDYGIFLLFHFT